MELFPKATVVERCKGLHLMRDNVLESAPDFNVSHHYM